MSARIVRWGLALAMAALAGLGCRPRLDAARLEAHVARPAPPKTRRVGASAARRPAWVDGAGRPGVRVLVGRGVGPTQGEAMAAAERDLSSRLAEALGAQIEARAFATTRADALGVEGTSRDALRVRAQARAVRPDARYFERLEGPGGGRFEAYARLEVARAELLRARAARGARPSDGVRVLLRFEGPRAGALERSVFFGALGAPGFDVVDPALAEAAGPEGDAHLARRLGAGVVVWGVVEADPPSVTLRSSEGATSSVVMRSWSELADALPSALRYLLLPGRGRPRAAEDAR